MVHISLLLFFFEKKKEILNQKLSGPDLTPTLCQRRPINHRRSRNLIITLALSYCLNLSISPFGQRRALGFYIVRPLSFTILYNSSKLIIQKIILYSTQKIKSHMLSDIKSCKILIKGIQSRNIAVILLLLYSRF